MYPTNSWLSLGNVSIGILVGLFNISNQLMALVGEREYWYTSRPVQYIQPAHGSRWGT